MMAMAVNHGLSCQFGSGEVLLVLEKFRQGKGLFFQTFGSGEARKQIRQLIAKDRATTRFKYHKGRSTIDFRAKGGENAPQIVLGHVEETIIV